MKMIPILLALSILCLWGCSSPKTVNIDTTNDSGRPVMELDYRDFDQAASRMVQSLIESGALQKADGGRYVVTTGRIINDTMLRIDTDQLMAKVEQELMNSGLVVMTSAVGGRGATDDMVHQMRDLRESDQSEEFDSETLPSKGQLIAPELSVAGKIKQSVVTYDKKRQQVEYYFQLQLTDLASGLRFWQEEVVLGKRGDKKIVPW